MKSGRESKGTPSADLLVCFPSRLHLSLMPKPICSPARKLSSIARARALKTSPLIWTKPKTMGGGSGSDQISEPSSPKVTCAGQIKIRPKTSSCKSWQSVMEEIERIHSRKKTNWVDSFGIKKDIMQFLTCLRSFRFDFRCFKAFPESDFTTDDEDDDDEEDEKSQENQAGADENENSRTAFSKWFMVLQENREEKKKLSVSVSAAADDISIEEQIVPPSNALLLMRCRSAPAKSWLEEEQEEEREVKVKIKTSLKWLMEEENKERLLLEIDSDFYKLSSDIAKETWVVSENSRDLMSRSRSWKS